MAYKTPGVYIEELSIFPPSVAAVETAVPAFVGYTEKALDSEKKDLTNKPTKISSLLEYTEYFGGAYNTDEYTITVDTDGNKIEAVEPDKRFYLYDSLRMYFDNGGGDCYIVSVGSYEDTVIYEDVTTPSDPKGLKVGVEKLFQFDEPTLILFPDAVNLLDSTDPDYVSFGSLQKVALKQCYDLKDRFVIMDIMEGYDEDTIDTQIENFRTNVGTQYLKYGAVYHPWLNSTYEPDIKFSQLKFQESDETEITDLTDFSDGDSTLEEMVSSLEAVSGDVDDLIDLMETDTSLELQRGEEIIEDYLKTFKKDIKANKALKTNFTNYMNTLANIALTLVGLDSDVEDELQENIDTLQTDTDLLTAIYNLIAMEKHASMTSDLFIATRTAAATLYSPLDSTDWLGGDTFADVTASTVTISGSNTQLAFVEALKDVEEELVSTFISFYNVAQHYETIAENIVFEGHSFFKDVVDRITKQMSLLPPSGAVAGVYCTVDNTRGVWKAPANTSLSSTLAPSIQITETDQGSLNVHSTGKSINCIRSFTGRGILVWGARTLAGNDNEWRYVNVRRFFNMVEESVKKATEQYVFEPNDANTWVKVRAMIENFLLLQWRQGALAGAKPDQAFYVKVGLGETMTSLDILEGRMNIEIGMAVVRPAEFIILKFSHKMQEA